MFTPRCHEALKERASAFVEMCLARGDGLLDLFRALYGRQPIEHAGALMKIAILLAVNDDNASLLYDALGARL